MKYSIVIPTYNHCDDLLTPCINNILKYTTMDDNIEIIVVANGCKDNTKEYLDSLAIVNLKVLWFDESIGYTRATNEGIKLVDPTSEYIILLNNDAFLLDQPKNQWIDMLEAPMVKGDNKVGVTGPMLGYNTETDRNFLIFFCVMIRASVLKEVGLLDEIFSPGSGEDVDFCIRIENMGYKIMETGDTFFGENSMIGSGSFPIYHEGEKTVHDTNLVQGWKDIFKRNMHILKARYPVDTVNDKNVLPDGWFSDKDIKIYKDLAYSIPDNSKILELGVWKGRSLCSIADIIKEKNLKVWAIDTFEGTDSTPYEKNHLAEEAKRINIQDIFEQNIKDFGLQDYITVIKGSTFDKHILFEDKTFDLLFLDADHSFEAVVKDIKNWYPKVKSHGIFSGHDIAWSSVENAVCEYFGKNFNYSVGANVWWVYKPKIYDCFPFFNELDLLDIRLNELHDVVDEFILVESTKTFSGKDKPLYFNDNKDMFAKFLPKITHIIQSDSDTGNNYKDNWTREESQRNKIMEVLASKCKPIDVIISSDLDEIPRASAVKEYVLRHAKNGIMIMDQKYSYYYLNNFTTDCKWQEGRIFPFWEAEKYTLSQLRRGPTHHGHIQALENAGWHFSFLGDAEHIRYKIESFAHTEFDDEEVKSEANIKHAMETGSDLFHRGNTKFNPVKIDETFPKYILNNIDKYKQLGYFRESIDYIELTPYIKLNLGCGNLTYPDCINIDLYSESADVKMDVRKLEYPDNYADEIIAYHIFEHLSPYDAYAVLSEWHRVLKPSGKLIMELPDIAAICNEFENATKDEKYRLLNCIYGTTQPEHPHLFGWYPEIMADHLFLVGFVGVSVPPIQLTHHWGINFRIESYKPSSVLNQNIIINEEPSKPKVFDTFLFFNEFDTLELRLNELNDVVDTFVLVECNKTFTGNNKPFYFNDNKDRFEKFKDKILHVKVEVSDADILTESDMRSPSWNMEANQRNKIFDALHKLKDNIKDNDVVILSDVDEIPRPDVVANYNTSNGMSSMHQDLFYYYLNCKADIQWIGSKIATWGEFKNFTATQIRKNSALPVIKNGGWHFSFMSNVSGIVDKINAFSHEEYNTAYFKNVDRILERVTNGEDIFDRPISFSAVDIDTKLPKYIINNENYYSEKKLIWKNILTQ